MIRTKKQPFADLRLTDEEGDYFDLKEGDQGELLLVSKKGEVTAITADDALELGAALLRWGRQ